MKTTDTYVKTTGFDEKHPMVALPIEGGAGSSSGYCDYYYCSETGNRVARVGGAFNGGANAGLWYWYCNYSSTTSNLDCGARLLKNQ